MGPQPRETRRAICLRSPSNCTWNSFFNWPLICLDSFCCVVELADKCLAPMNHKTVLIVMAILWTTNGQFIRYDLYSGAECGLLPEWNLPSFCKHRHDGNPANRHRILCFRSRFPSRREPPTILGGPCSGTASSTLPLEASGTCSYLGGQWYRFTWPILGTFVAVGMSMTQALSLPVEQPVLRLLLRQHLVRPSIFASRHLHRLDRGACFPISLFLLVLCL